MPHLIKPWNKKIQMVTKENKVAFSHSLPYKEFAPSIRQRMSANDVYIITNPWNTANELLNAHNFQP